MMSGRAGKINEGYNLKNTGGLKMESSAKCQDCKYAREEKCTRTPAGGVEAIHGAECLEDIIELERERYTG
jgi:hypothetical protein